MHLDLKPTYQSPRNIPIMQHMIDTNYLPSSWDVHQNAVWTGQRPQEGTPRCIPDISNWHYDHFSLATAMSWKESFRR